MEEDGMLEDGVERVEDANKRKRGKVDPICSVGGGEFETIYIERWGR